MIVKSICCDIDKTWFRRGRHKSTESPFFAILSGAWTVSISSLFWWHLRFWNSRCHFILKHSFRDFLWKSCSENWSSLKNTCYGVLIGYSPTILGKYGEGWKKKQEKLDKSRKLWCMPFDNFWLVVSKIHLLDLGVGCNLIQFWGTPKFLYLFRSQIYVVRPLMRQVYYTRYQARFTCGESNLYWNSKWHNYDDQHCSPETLLEKGLCCVSFVHNFATILRVGIYRIFSFIHVNGRFNSLIV